MSARKYAETLLEASRRMSADSAYRSLLESDFEASSALFARGGCGGSVFCDRDSFSSQFGGDVQRGI